MCLNNRQGVCGDDRDVSPEAHYMDLVGSPLIHLYILIYTCVLLCSTLYLHVPLPYGRHENPPVNPSLPENLPVVHLNRFECSNGRCSGRSRFTRGH